MDGKMLRDDSPQGMLSCTWCGRWHTMLWAMTRRLRQGSESSEWQAFTWSSIYYWATKTRWLYIVNLVVRYCIALIRATRSNLTSGPMEEHNRNFSHAKARPSIRSMKTKIWGWSHGFKNKRLRVHAVQFSWWPHLPHLWTKACSASLINFN